MNNTRKKLSVVIITYNEEANIARCLESVRDIADEIVVVDSLSEDKTREIAEKYSVRFIEHKFTGYIEQKNFALSRTSYFYVLSLDADEALSDKLKIEISEIKNHWEFDGYYINRLSNYCGRWIKHGAWYPDYKLRLFDRRKGKWTGFNPHDHVTMIPGTKTGKLKGKLLHYTYHSVGEQVMKMNLFSDIQAREYYRYGILPGVFKAFLHSSWRFIRDYLFKRGFLDGLYGYIIAVNSAHEAFLKYIKLRNIYQDLNNKPSSKILFINTNRFWGGGEKWNLDVVLFLRKIKKNVFFIVSENSALCKHLVERHIPVFKLKTGFAYYLNPLLLIRILRLLSFYNPETVVISLSNDLKLVGPVLKLKRIKNVIYRRGISLPVMDSVSNRILYRKVITSVVANSYETKNNILLKNPQLIPEEKIRVVYNGINAEVFLRKKGIPLYKKRHPDEIVIGNAGRLSFEKGHIHFIDIALYLKQRKIPFTILIAGEGEMYARLQDMIYRNNLSGEVKLLGFIKKMEEFYASIDVFALTSSYEGFGYVLLEAGLSKIPVVAFDIGSSAEIIVDGKTGFLVPREDTQAMSEKIITLCKDPEARKQMGEKAALRVRNYFDQQKSYAEFMKLLG